MNARVRVLLPIALVIATFAVSTASILIRLAQRDGAPSMVIAALRMSFAVFMLAPVALTRHWDEIRRFTRTEILLGVLSGVFLAAHFVTWITSLEYTNVVSSVVLVGTGPLWVALLSPMLLKERVSRGAVFGLVLALLGGTLIGLSGWCSISGGLSCRSMGDALGGAMMRGNFLALTGAWAVTGYLIIGRKLRAGMSLLPYIFLVYGMAAITLVVLMFLTGNAPFGYKPQTYGWIFLLAAVPQLIGHTTYNWALKYLTATLVAITVLGEPIGSAILAFFILKEIPVFLTIAGGVFILVGIYFSGKGS